MNQLTLFDPGPTLLDQLVVQCADEEAIYLASCPRCKALIFHVDGFPTDPAAVIAFEFYLTIGRGGMDALSPQDFGKRRLTREELDDERPMMHFCEREQSC